MSKITLEDLKRKFSIFSPKSIIISLVVLGVFVVSYRGSEIRISELINGLADMKDYIVGSEGIEGSLLRPDLDSKNLLTFAMSIIETLEMVFISTILSVIISLPLSFFMSRNLLKLFLPRNTILSNLFRGLIYYTVMLMANLSRSINELVWALIFVTTVGLGPMAGVMALTIHTTGVLIKLLSEGVENINNDVLKSLKSTGASFLKTVRFGVIPQITPYFVSIVLYRFESDVRSASILGFVGAGGIGFYLYDKIRSFENSSVSTIIIMIVITVMVIDKLSAYLRNKFS